MIGLQANTLFGTLPPDARASIAAAAEISTFHAGQEIYGRQDTAEHVYFPLTCLIGVSTGSSDGESTMLVICGHEGMVGLPGMISGPTEGGSAKVLAGGRAARVSAAVLRSQFESDTDVRHPLLRYMQGLIGQIGVTAHCVAHHTLVQRLAALLLRLSDRSPGSAVVMTHQGLADALGVRRETVSKSARDLQLRGLLQCGRGNFTVVDRARLEATACSCYESNGRSHVPLLAQREH